MGIFLRNRWKAIAAMDFFSTLTLTVGVLYCFFVIAHDRWRILSCNVTKHLRSVWVVQQLRDAFSNDEVPNFLIFDRATNFNEEVLDMVKISGMSPNKLTSEVRGKTASPSFGFSTAAGTCLIT